MQWSHAYLHIFTNKSVWRQPYLGMLGYQQFSSRSVHQLQSGSWFKDRSLASKYDPVCWVTFHIFRWCSTILSGVLGWYADLHNFSPTSTPRPVITACHSAANCIKKLWANTGQPVLINEWLQLLKLLHTGMPDLFTVRIAAPVACTSSLSVIRNSAFPKGEGAFVCTLPTWIDSCIGDHT